MRRTRRRSPASPTSARSVPRHVTRPRHGSRGRRRHPGPALGAVAIPLAVLLAPAAVVTALVIGRGGGPVAPADLVAAAPAASAPAVSPPPAPANRSATRSSASDSTSRTAASPSSGDGEVAALTGVSATPSAPADPYRTVGLGDSVPAAGACGCTSYVTLVGERVAREHGRAAAVDNLADGGSTTSDVRDQLNRPEVRADLARADLVILTVGANDFDEDGVDDPACAPPDLTCFRPALRAQAGRLDDLLDQVHELTAPHGGRVLVTGYWNVFLDGAVAQAQGSDYVRNSTALTLAENRQIAAAAAAHGATYVDLYRPFKGDGSTDDTSLLEPDGDHPASAGHQRIAGSLVRAVEALG